MLDLLGVHLHTELAQQLHLLLLKTSNLGWEGLGFRV